MEIKKLKVVELATVLAGPVVGSFFTEMGARVIKFENSLSHGDVTRQWKTPLESNSNHFSSYYAGANYHKEVRMVNLKNENERKIVYNELKDADVVISNFKPGSALKLGMDYEKIKSINPSIIYGSIDGYGKDDHRSAFDAILQAECGLMSMNGTEESGPLKWPLAMVDLLAAHQLKQGILLALLEREWGKGGANVSVSLYDAAISTLSNQGSNYLMNGEIPNRMGSLHPNIAPYGEVMTTKDGKQILLAVGNNKQFNALLKDLEMEELIGNEKFNSNEQRVVNREELKMHLKKGFASKESDEILSKFNLSGVPAAPINNLEEVFTHKKAQSLVLKEDINQTLTKRVKSAIFIISR